MQYDFDTPVERRGTGAIKWDGMEPAYGTNDLMPFWIADMDFRTPPFIIEALRRRLDHEVLGYSLKDDAYFESIIRWNRDRYSFAVEREWIHFMPGVVPALALALLFFTKEGDRVMLGLSGGKDSLTMLHCLLQLQRRSPTKFELACVTVDPQTTGFDPR